MKLSSVMFKTWISDMSSLQNVHICGVIGNPMLNRTAPISSVFVKKALKSKFACLRKFAETGTTSSLINEKCLRATLGAFYFILRRSIKSLLFRCESTSFTEHISSNLCACAGPFASFRISAEDGAVRFEIRLELTLPWHLRAASRQYLREWSF